MNRRELLGGAVALAALGAGRNAFGGIRELVGRPMPVLALSLPSGEGTSLSECHGGNRLVLHFWATWCRPCVTELPKLDQLQRELTDAKVGTVLAVCVDEHDVRARVAALMQSKGYVLPLAFDATGSAIKHFGLDSLPESLLVDGAGRVHSHHPGSIDWTDSDWVSRVGALPKG